MEGALPKGLRLDPDGALRGAATEAGSFKVTFRCEDRWKAGTQQAVSITVEKPDEDQQANQDQQQEGQQGDQQQQQDGKQQKDEGEQKDQQQQAGKDGEPGEKGDKKEEQQQAEAKSGESGKSAEEQAKEDAQQQAAQIQGAAADHWLQQLPPEDRNVLRYQLLEGGQHPSKKTDKPW
jgi:hypothetical protein